MQRSMRGRAPLRANTPTLSAKAASMQQMLRGTHFAPRLSLYFHS
jgi:hypothetical protein